jgi:calcineurin-like phosphoesterase family protein
MNTNFLKFTSETITHLNSVWFTADPHFGHKNIITMCNRPFTTIEEMNFVLIDKWNQRVKPTDEVFLLGDVFYHISYKDALTIREQLNGKIHLILGNHDKIAKNMGGWASVSESFEYKTTLADADLTIFLNHYAHRVWNHSYQGNWHLYGHSHGKLPENPASPSFDCGVDCWNYYPISLEHVINKMTFKKQEILRPFNAI